MKKTRCLRKCAFLGGIGCLRCLIVLVLYVTVLLVYSIVRCGMMLVSYMEEDRESVFKKGDERLAGISKAFSFTLAFALDAICNRLFDAVLLRFAMIVW